MTDNNSDFFPIISRFYLSIHVRPGPRAWAKPAWTLRNQRTNKNSSHGSDGTKQESLFSTTGTVLIDVRQIESSRHVSWPDSTSCSFFVWKRKLEPSKRSFFFLVALCREETVATTVDWECYTIQNQFIEINVSHKSLVQTLTQSNKHTRTYTLV